MIELGWVVHKTYWNYLRQQMGIVPLPPLLRPKNEIRSDLRDLEVGGEGNRV